MVFKKEKAIRVDKFIVIHLRNLAETTMLLNSASEKNKKKNLHSQVTHNASRIVCNSSNTTILPN